MEVIPFATYSFLGYTTLEFIGNNFVFATICSGPSMNPTINTAGDGVVVIHTKEYNVGDIVVSKSPNDPEKNVCKRVRAVSGDVVSFRSTYGSFHRVIIPQGHVWLQGDNSSNSIDSREYGPVPTGLLFGRALCRLSITNSPHFEIFSKEIPDYKQNKALRVQLEQIARTAVESDDDNTPKDKQVVQEPEVSKDPNLNDSEKKI